MLWFFYYTRNGIDNQNPQNYRAKDYRKIA